MARVSGYFSTDSFDSLDIPEVDPHFGSTNTSGGTVTDNNSFDWQRGVAWRMHRMMKFQKELVWVSHEVLHYMVTMEESGAQNAVYIYLCYSSSIYLLS